MTTSLAGSREVDSFPVVGVGERELTPISGSRAFSPRSDENWLRSTMYAYPRKRNLDGFQAGASPF